MALSDATDSRSHTKPPAVLARVEKMGECASRQSPGLSPQAKEDDFTQDLLDLHQRAEEGICGGARCNSEQPTSQVSYFVLQVPGVSKRAQSCFLLLFALPTSREAD
jgi:hypothetical protein